MFIAAWKKTLNRKHIHFCANDRVQSSVYIRAVSDKIRRRGNHYTFVRRCESVLYSLVSGLFSTDHSDQLICNSSVMPDCIPFKFHSTSTFGCSGIAFFEPLNGPLHHSLITLPTLKWTKNLCFTIVPDLLWMAPLAAVSDLPIWTWSVWLRDTNADVSSIHETWMFPEWIKEVKREW